MALAIHQYRTRRVAQHIFGGAAENHLDDAAVAVGADEQEIVIQVD